MRRLRKAFEYLEKYDELGNYPDKKIPVSISLPLLLKHKLSKIENVSKYVEHLIVKDLKKKGEDIPGFIW
ncbi:hypothetical protein HYV81_01920 [Candidatus Woesearchaeota archaeon]|nr:hypothetical protein [Candidatus Woesearchaeota archaeon]